MCEVDPSSTACLMNSQMVAVISSMRSKLPCRLVWMYSEVSSAAEKAEQ